MTSFLPGHRLAWIDGFLSAPQCAAILAELRFAFWWPSTVTAGFHEHPVGDRISGCRVSETTDESWFTPYLLGRLNAIDRRLERLVPGFRARREPWQATRYGKGGKFEYHFDCGYWAREAAGDREWSVLIYLDTPRAGGSTHFSLLDVQVKARAGRLLTWSNLLDNHEADLEMLHASLPLRCGTKTVLVTWVRQRPVKRRRT